MNPPNTNPTDDRTAPQPPHAGGGHDAGHDAGHGEEMPKDLHAPSGLVVVAMVALFALLLAALFLVGYVPDKREQAQTRKEAADRGAAKPIVQWTHPFESSGEKSVRLPCDVTAYQQTALYTRTNGYLKEWHYDLGQHVDQGQLMAVIETPEVDAQLEQSKATLEQNKANVAKAEADLDLAKVTLQRYVDAQKTSPGSVTQEDVDTRRSGYEDAVAALKQVHASVTQAQANVQQLQVTVNFEKIYAPFSGTVTARNYDVGALLSPTDSGPGKEIFDLAETDKLRVFVNVPQTYASYVKRGQKAQLEVVNFPGRKFEGTITYTAGAIDPNTRTLRTQIDFDNADGSLFAGAYGQLFLPVTPQQAVSVIPSSSLIFNAAGTEVATLGPDEKVHVRTIELGRDLGTELQVTKGLDAADRVIVNPGERTTEGSEVNATEAPKEVPAKPATTNPARSVETTPPPPHVPEALSTGH